MVVLAGAAFLFALIWLIPLVRGTGDTATWFSLLVVVVSVLAGSGLTWLALGLLRPGR